MTVNLVLTLIVAAIGGITALRFKVPAGAMIGAMLSVAVFNIITGSAFLPSNVKVVTQIYAGAFIGAGITYKDIMDLRYLLKPALILTTGMMGLSFAMGILMYKLTGIDIVTSLFSCAPGGIVDMSLISQDMGADASKVAILQLVRVISVIGMFPLILRFVSLGLGKRGQVSKPENSKEMAVDSNKEQGITKETKALFRVKAANLTLTSVIAVAAGLSGYFLKVPAGAITFSMIAVAVFGIFSGKGYMPLTARRITQVFAGALVGEGMTLANLVSLKHVALPVIILITGYILINLCIGYIIHKTSGFDLATSLFACAPGGVTDMALIARDLGADTTKIAVLQLARLASVIAFFPIIIKAICT